VMRRSLVGHDAWVWDDMGNKVVERAMIVLTQMDPAKTQLQLCTGRARERRNC
jgi:hypothetical protein